jgi:hypothetical protein
MQALFRQNAASAAVGNFSIEERRWENLPLGSLSGFDLILACNSLHATNVGFAAALEKVFAAGASLVFEDGHFWLKNTARVRLEWWTRTA